MFVGSLPEDISETAVERVFREYGEVLGVKVIQTQRGTNAASAIVRYAATEEAEAAIEALNGKYEFLPGEGPIKAKHAKPNPRWEGSS